MEKAYYSTSEGWNQSKKKQTVFVDEFSSSKDSHSEGLILTSVFKLIFFFFPLLKVMFKLISWYFLLPFWWDLFAFRAKYMSCWHLFIMTAFRMLYQFMISGLFYQRRTLLGSCFVRILWNTLRRPFSTSISSLLDQHFCSFVKLSSITASSLCLMFFLHCRPEWSHAFYLGKLCEKLGFSCEKACSYYSKAITLNPSAVDPVYRMHASRLKLLFKSGKHDINTLQVKNCCLITYWQY